MTCSLHLQKRKCCVAWESKGLADFHSEPLNKLTQSFYKEIRKNVKKEKKPVNLGFSCLLLLLPPVFLKKLFWAFQKSHSLVHQCLDAFSFATFAILCGHPFFSSFAKANG